MKVTHSALIRVSAFVLSSAVLFLLGCKAKPSNPADIIFTNAAVLTMNDAQPTAKAVAVKDGKILAVGAAADVEKFKGDSTQVRDLNGKTLLPGFVDPHGHMFNAGIQAIAANLLAPPDGTVTSIAQLQQTLRDWESTAAAQKTGWIIGFGYDDSQLQEKRHPTRQELDAVSREKPVLIIHQSGHLATVNSKLLEMMNLTAASKDPDGGAIQREKDGKTPSGVLEESAFWMVLPKLPSMTDADRQVILRKGEEAYARFGYTTAQEGRSTLGTDKAYFEAAEQKSLVLDVDAYPDIDLASADMNSPYAGRDYKNHFRIAGAKLNVDGSPQGRTAYLTKPYFKVPPGQKPDYRGYPAYPPEKIDAFVDKAFANNWQILAHCNGDGAADLFIHAVRAAEQKYGKADRRPVMVHAQTVREDQLDAMKELGIIPSFFSMHTYYWGDWHRDVTLGQERAFRISPAMSAKQRGMIWTSHTDAPVALPNAMIVLASQVTRVARGSGQVIGPDQRVPVQDALKAMTIWAAYQDFEEQRKGSIEPGKLADFVVLSDNPTQINPMKLWDLKVLETVKEGKTIYKQ